MSTDMKLMILSLNKNRRMCQTQAGCPNFLRPSPLNLFFLPPTFAPATPGKSFLELQEQPACWKLQLLGRCFCRDASTRPRPIPLQKFRRSFRKGFDRSGFMRLAVHPHVCMLPPLL
eukprot:Blabericola_migrator_1__9751@NODE_533_length_7781_cov_67_029168_g406_i0_p6_GENE_NODE_533_length_7781_cov_67_029168_g406_i0NODE_533_length_7781_cov_67_029168_g406_i0_p6_ORF_typecomplete_len117_score5_34_NODE_533_length_7781_cov_67_029168_g406_i021322482